MATYKTLNILVVGGGIGGTVAAYWLARAGHQVTVVEKYPALRAGGTQIDLRHQGVILAKRMGLMESIKPYLVEETGFAIVDKNNNTKVFYGAGDGDFLTQEIEILRGDLVRVLYEHTQDNVRYVFGKTVEAYEQDDKTVNVTFSDESKGMYDLLIGADGLGSRIRKSIHPPDADPIKSLDMAVAFWFMPKGKTDSTVARMYYASGRKMMMLRTANATVTQALVGCRGDGKELRSLLKVSEDQQKDFWIQRYKSAGWEADRMLSSLKNGDATAFYSTEIAQIKTPIWSKGRIVLVADAAHSPSPLTGMGTNSAFVGAYVLAGEIATHPDDLETAFKNYDQKLRPFAEMIQEIPGSVELFMPDSDWGIAVLHVVMIVMKWAFVVAGALKLDVFWDRLFPDPKKAWQLPEYLALA